MANVKKVFLDSPATQILIAYQMFALLIIAVEVPIIQLALTMITVRHIVVLMKDVLKVYLDPFVTQIMIVNLVIVIMLLL